MLKALAEVDFEDLLRGTRACIITLTMPRDWLQVAPNAAEFKRLFRIWRKRYAHRWGGLRGFWKLEFQRGSKTREPAPHLHIFTAVPVGSTLKDFRDWVGASWAEVVNHPDPLQREHHRLAGTQVDIPKSNLAPREATAYFLKRSATHSAGPVEGVKEYQHQVPPSWEVAGGSGRFWGIVGLARRREEQQISREFAIELGRMLRKAARSKKRTVRVSRPRRRLDHETGELVPAGTRKTTVRQSYLRGGRGFMLLDDPEKFLADAVRWWLQDPRHAEP